jgi:hypothetical protein
MSNAYFKAREIHLQFPASSVNFPPKNVTSLNHTSSLLAVWYSSSEPTHHDRIDDRTNHSVLRHLLGGSLGPNPSYSTSPSLGRGRSICRGDSTFFFSLHVLMSIDQLSSVPLRGEDACLISTLASLSSRCPPLRGPVAPRCRAITRCAFNRVPARHMRIRGLEEDATRARYLLISTTALTLSMT